MESKAKKRRVSSSDDEEQKVSSNSPPTNKTPGKMTSSINGFKGTPGPSGALSLVGSRHDKPAELFRKDLISAMKLADSEPLQQEEYVLIADQWRMEWEKGVQVPVNAQSIPEIKVRKVPGRENLHGLYGFKLPRKFLHSMQDETYKQGIHDLTEMHKLAEQVCRYDLDDQDVSWLSLVNPERQDIGEPVIEEWLMERIIEELESQCHDNMQIMIKTVEGLGIEYDENVICDVCRSPDSEDNNEMVFCDHCDICVHQACYGIQKIPTGSWLCRPCALGIKPSCILCPKRGGAMKSTKSGTKWAHVSCALWIPEVSIGCAEKMEPITKISHIPSSRWALVCCLCRERTGACIQCSLKMCKTAFHVTCAFQQNLDMKTILEDDDDDVKLQAYCPKHSKKKNDDDRKDGLSSHLGTPKKAMTEEEKTELRSHRLQKLAEEFYSCVKVPEVASALQLPNEMVDYVYNYWLLKRKSNFNKPLLTPRREEADLLSKQQEDSLVARMKMFVHLRQDLERVRNLCYMVNRREKIRRQLYRTKEEIFYKQVSLLEDPNNRFGTRELKSIVEAHRGLTLYDNYDGILRCADRGFSEDSLKFESTSDLVPDNETKNEIASCRSRTGNDLVGPQEGCTVNVKVEHDTSKLRTLARDLNRRRDRQSLPELNEDSNGVREQSQNCSRPKSAGKEGQSSSNHSDRRRDYRNRLKLRREQARHMRQFRSYHAEQPTSSTGVEKDRTNVKSEVNGLLQKSQLVVGESIKEKVQSKLLNKALRPRTLLNGVHDHSQQKHDSFMKEEIRNRSDKHVSRQLLQKSPSTPTNKESVHRRLAGDLTSSREKLRSESMRLHESIFSSSPKGTLGGYRIPKKTPVKDTSSGTTEHHGSSPQDLHNIENDSEAALSRHRPDYELESNCSEKHKCESDEESNTGEVRSSRRRLESDMESCASERLPETRSVRRRIESDMESYTSDKLFENVDGEISIRSSRDTTPERGTVRRSARREAEIKKLTSEKHLRKRLRGRVSGHNSDSDISEDNSVVDVDDSDSELMMSDSVSESSAYTGPPNQRVTRSKVLENADEVSVASSHSSGGKYGTRSRLNDHWSKALNALHS